MGISSLFFAFFSPFPSSVNAISGERPTLHFFYEITRSPPSAVLNVFFFSPFSHRVLPACGPPSLSISTPVRVPNFLLHSFVVLFFLSVTVEHSPCLRPLANPSKPFLFTMSKKHVEPSFSSVLVRPYLLSVWHSGHLAPLQSPFPTPIRAKVFFPLPIQMANSFVHSKAPSLNFVFFFLRRSHRVMSFFERVPLSFLLPVSQPFRLFLSPRFEDLCRPSLISKPDF